MKNAEISAVFGGRGQVEPLRHYRRVYGVYREQAGEQQMIRTLKGPV